MDEVFSEPPSHRDVSRYIFNGDNSIPHTRAARFNSLTSETTTSTPKARENKVGSNRREEMDLAPEKCNDDLVNRVAQLSHDGVLSHHDSLSREVANQDVNHVASAPALEATPTDVEKSCISFDGENFLAKHKDEENNEYLVVIDPPGQEYSARKRVQTRSLDLSSISGGGKCRKISFKAVFSPSKIERAVPEAPSPSASAVIPISVAAPFVSSSIKQNLTLATSSPGAEKARSVGGDIKGYLQHQAD